MIKNDQKCGTSHPQETNHKDWMPTSCHVCWGINSQNGQLRSICFRFFKIKKSASKTITEAQQLLRPGPRPCSLAAFHTSAVTGRWRLWPRRATSQKPQAPQGFHIFHSDPWRTGRTGGKPMVNLLNSYENHIKIIMNRLETYWNPENFGKGTESGSKTDGASCSHARAKRLMRAARSVDQRSFKTSPKSHWA